MTTLREAAQQTLEVLESGLLVSHSSQVVTALRAALAQQAEPVQEPITRLFGTLPVHDAQQAEPVEPVAQYSDIVSDGGMDPRNKYDTAPPQRKLVPLTEEDEIMDAVREADLDWQAGWTLDEHEPNRFTTLVRAIENASWEKNHGQT